MISTRSGGGLTVREHFHRCGIDLTEEQEGEIIRLDNLYAGAGMPGFAWHLARVLSVDLSLRRVVELCERHSAHTG